MREDVTEPDVLGLMVTVVVFLIYEFLYGVRTGRAAAGLFLLPPSSFSPSLLCVDRRTRLDGIPISDTHDSSTFNGPYLRFSSSSSSFVLVLGFVWWVASGCLTLLISPNFLFLFLLSCHSSLSSPPSFCSSSFPLFLEVVCVVLSKCLLYRTSHYL